MNPAVIVCIINNKRYPSLPHKPCGAIHCALRELVSVISADNLASGIASAAFIAYMSGSTSRGYSATQYALFSSLMLLLPKFIAGFSGVFVNAYGYETFFCATALLGLPVLVLV
jgi:PAT family beta-lactamase induction signal transducer AmpG